MKIWNSYGTEHSMNLVMIGRFKTEEAARKIEETIEALQKQLPEHISTDSSERRFPESVSALLREHNCYIFHPVELQHFLYDISVRREGDTISMWTDESEISGFIKLMLEGGAKVEVFSRHDHPEQDNESQ